MRYFFLATQILLLGLLSLASGYTLPNLADSDWSTVLFLTPFGILSNFAFPSAITSFYGEIASGHFSFAQGKWAAPIAYLAVLGNFLWRSK